MEKQNLAVNSQECCIHFAKHAVLGIKQLGENLVPGMALLYCSSGQGKSQPVRTVTQVLDGQHKL